MRGRGIRYCCLRVIQQPGGIWASWLEVSSLFARVDLGTGISTKAGTPTFVRRSYLRPRVSEPALYVLCKVQVWKHIKERVAKQKPTDKYSLRILLREPLERLQGLPEIVRGFFRHPDCPTLI